VAITISPKNESDALSFFDEKCFYARAKCNRKTAKVPERKRALKYIRVTKP